MSRRMSVGMPLVSPRYQLLTHHLAFLLEPLEHRLKLIHTPLAGTRADLARSTSSLLRSLWVPCLPCRSLLWRFGAIGTNTALGLPVRQFDSRLVVVGKRVRGTSARAEKIWWRGACVAPWDTIGSLASVVLSWILRSLCSVRTEIRSSWILLDGALLSTIVEKILVATGHSTIGMADHGHTVAENVADIKPDASAVTVDIDLEDRAAVTTERDLSILAVGKFDTTLC